MTADHLVSIAQRYADHRGYRLTTVGAYAVNDGKFFDRLLAGGSCTMRTADKVLRYLASHWPVDLEWPRDIPRPDKTKEAA
ncbi:MULTISPECIES: hypothetical protein [unclassified Paracoccus (in: a-proteobacteria)]|uniref:hypothetical protein n=1 Tax=unclassified Paracoccus (in: a-proteobacteria) TaxID=2688777 RepID=UPI0012B357C4|nr:MULTISPECIES: hypothetical protein [unclassified Paracoccus (in: a-proteobacteria)]UXU74327.1 hypothetical protein GB879_010500 [Paracoccus sp. SMMA_5]UXU80217.1 hypothetical protein GB880_010475 [Paracoccus sp. SMMA_5_TC]